MMSKWPDEEKPIFFLSHAEMKDLSAHNVYGAVGQCIYCGRASSLLTREHILPAGLAGRHEIPQASCKRCAELTSKLERRLLRGPFWPIRAKAGIRSRRRPKQRPESFRRTYRRGKIEAEEGISVSQFIPILCMPGMRMPAYFSGEDIQNQDDAASVLIVSSPEDFDTLTAMKKDLAQVGAEGLRFHEDNFVDPLLMRRFTAKVTHGLAVGELGSIYTSRVQKFILGEEDHLARYYAGALFAKQVPNIKLLETGAAVVIRVDTDPNEVIGLMTIFYSSISFIFAAALGTVEQQMA